MAVRRSLIEAIGGFRPDLGRNGKELLGQEQAEFFYRSRQAGAQGLYVPAMVLDHVVPASRLTRNYFRRWWYWKGVSHARVHQMHGRTELNVDLRNVPRVLGIPRFVYGNVVRNIKGWLRGWVRRDPAKRAQHWMSLAYYAGYCREIWRPTTLGREGVQSKRPALSRRSRRPLSSLSSCPLPLSRDYFTSNVVITGRWSEGATPLELRTSNTCEALMVVRLAPFDRNT